MHDDTAAGVDEERRLNVGTFVRGVVVCHHPFGVGIYLDDEDQYGHVDVSHIRDGLVRGSEDYPGLGVRTSAVVLGYSGLGQLRLTTRLSDLPGYN